MKIYIATSLTHVPRNHFDNYTNLIHTLAIALKKEHRVKYALVDSDPQLEFIADDDKARQCYVWDRKMVEDSDLVIAECSFPSVGLGIELQLAENNNIPVILIYRSFGYNKASEIRYTNPDHNSHNLQIGNGFVSLMALGLPNLADVIQYSSLNNLVVSLNRLLIFNEEIVLMNPGDSF